MLGVLSLKKIRIFALIAAAATALALYAYLNSLKAPREIPKAAVAVAITDIAADTVITADMVGQTELPGEALLPGAASDPERLVGKVAGVDIVAGEQILPQKLAEPGGEGSDTLAYAIAPGMRAITISVTEVSGLYGMVKPGNRVDIIAHYQAEVPVVQSDGTTKDETVFYTALLLANIKVLAVDNVLSKKGKVPTESDSSLYKTITLEVTPKQALDTSFTQYNGQLAAILRSPVDEETPELKTITIDDLPAG
jgi:pilus assembly protein CpaB